MKNLDKAVGLCVNCKYIHDCSSPNVYKNNIHFCELHETNEPQIYAIDAAKPAPKESKHVSESKNNPKGLCANCELISECTIEKPEDGIWHCEEYI